MTQLNDDLGLNAFSTPRSQLWIPGPLSFESLPLNPVNDYVITTKSSTLAALSQPATLRQHQPKHLLTHHNLGEFPLVKLNAQSGFGRHVNQSTIALQWLLQ